MLADNALAEMTRKSAVISFSPLVRFWTSTLVSRAEVAVVVVAAAGVVEAAIAAAMRAKVLAKAVVHIWMPAQPDLILQAGENSGDGFITIAVVAPEPTPVALLALGLGLICMASLWRTMRKTGAASSGR